MNRRNLLLAGTIVTGGLAIGFWPGGKPGDPGLLPGISAANAQGTSEIEDITLGDPNAPVKVVEYASFTCPHCAAFHQETFKDFRREYVDTGRVHFTYREVFFDRYGLWAAMIARCGGPERYFGIADLIYAQQSNWARAGEPAEVADALKKLGLQAGLSQAELDACLQDAEQAQGLVNWYEANAGADGIKSTPSFVIDGEVHSGNMSLDALGELIDAAAS
ncbi:DsbA family protein [Jannaschia sp. W003]|uniref:DsbA family protein n=1 Tax=Jannaschia sp. W003 TaxID=2867012 RepID=UPI0021A9702E|nr:DsbA family protein [Jannaschia sp. W003]UWQ21718.1 DsbA family protein [Jannaschia sp. W003]